MIGPGIRNLVRLAKLGVAPICVGGIFGGLGSMMLAQTVLANSPDDDRLLRSGLVVCAPVGAAEPETLVQTAALFPVPARKSFAVRVHQEPDSRAADAACRTLVGQFPVAPLRTRQLGGAFERLWADAAPAETRDEA